MTSPLDLRRGPGGDRAPAVTGGWQRLRAGHSGLLWRTVCAFAGFVIAVVLTSAYAWSASSSGHWAADVIWLLALEALLLGLRLPDLTRSPTAVRWLVHTLALLGAASIIRGLGLPWRGAPVSLFLAIAALAAVLSGTVAAHRPWPRRAVDVELSFPLTGDGWLVAVGGYMLNHHKAAPAQWGALDFVRAGPGGRTANRFLPTNNESFAAYGSVVLAPCDGTVAQVRDGEPDQTPFRILPGPATGNCVLIDTGRERVLLAHLKPGSVQPRVGDRVRAGDPLGEVGNTGNSTEPHLHIHAERDGVGLRLRFHGLGDVWYRGRRVAPRPGPGSAQRRPSPPR